MVMRKPMRKSAKIRGIHFKYEILSFWMKTVVAVFNIKPEWGTNSFIALESRQANKQKKMNADNLVHIILW